MGGLQGSVGEFGLHPVSTMGKKCKRDNEWIKMTFGDDLEGGDMRSCEIVPQGI